jgi:phosphoenolpyruvate carboxykinase (ATP)
LRNYVPQFTIFVAPRFHASPTIDGTNSEAFIIVNFGKRLIIIGGTSYAGEIKKAVFTVLNYLLPQGKVLSMHCSANMGTGDDVALFFGLSGTGKTTLSTDAKRKLIGDDEHGWSDNGIFNFEGGCYAKVIRISKEQEPQIYECTRRFGTVLENVYIDNSSRRLDLNHAELTENTRACYPITHIEHSIRSGMGPHPKNIFMLSYDAFGVMPPIAMLTAEQAVYYFLQGYTAKVAHTEVGMNDEPNAVFSPCFGAPFMVLPPLNYARLLLDNIKKHKVNCWLVNTGLVNGGFGQGKRISLLHTRALIRAVLKGNMPKTGMKRDRIFGFMVPEICEDIPQEILQPASIWKDSSAYETQAKKLAAKFIENFHQFSGNVPASVMDVGPKIS